METERTTAGDQCGRPSQPQSDPEGTGRSGRPGSSIEGALRLLIVARERVGLLALAQGRDDLHVIGEVGSGIQAKAAARTLRPDLLLLDAELPDMSGLELMRLLRPKHQKRTILMTANAHDRATAFAAGAIDCLLKPVVAESFSAAMQRAGTRLKASGAQAGRASVPRSAPRSAADEPAHPLFLVGEREHCLYPLEPENIDYIESEGNYVKYHIATVEFIARESVKRLDAVLGRAGFLRIERSILLNTHAIAYVQSIGHGTFAFTLLSGARLYSSHAYRDKILEVLPLRRRAPGAVPPRD